MRKEWISAAAGIGLVFLAAIAFMCFCRYTDGRERADQDANKVYSFSGHEEKYADTKIKFADERGFAVYKQLPEPVAKLVDTGIFAPTEEDVKRYMEIYGDDAGFDDDDDDEADGDLLQGDYGSEVEKINKIGTAAYLEETNHIGPELGGCMYCFLTWDESAGRFADADKIAEIEQCGFFGFSDLMAEAEKMIRNRRAAAKNEDAAYGIFGDEYQCKIYCQGVGFELRRCPVQKYYRLLCPINTAVYYIPEKYRNVIDEVTALGGYIPYYYSIGGKKEVLIFNRDNSIECDSVCPRSDAGAESYDNKRMAFIYEDGKLADYYVATQKNKLELDDADKKILDRCASRLGKTLSERGEQSNSGGHEVWLYRTE